MGDDQAEEFAGIAQHCAMCRHHRLSAVLIREGLGKQQVRLGRLPAGQEIGPVGDALGAVAGNTGKPQRALGIEDEIARHLGKIPAQCQQLALDARLPIGGGGGGREIGAEFVGDQRGRGVDPAQRGDDLTGDDVGLVRAGRIHRQLGLLARVDQEIAEQQTRQNGQDQKVGDIGPRGAHTIMARSGCRSSSPALFPRAADLPRRAMPQVGD